MAVNTTLAGLSQTPSLNGPDGTTDAPSTVDDALRYHGKFLAELRDGLGFTGQLGGKNRIHNGTFNINQRIVSGSVVLAAGAYGHDRWKGGSSGCTYTFSSTGITTTITISAGSLVQVVEGQNVEGGTYCMSWTGTATGKIGGGSLSASGVTASGVTAGANLSLEFSTGTLANVQLEPGATATAFERRPFGLERMLCLRYFYSINGAVIFGLGQATTTTNVALFVNFGTAMIGNPTMTANQVSANAAGGSPVVANTATLANSGISTALINLTMASASFTAGHASVALGSASVSYLRFSAEL